MKIEDLADAVITHANKPITLNQLNFILFTVNNVYSEELGHDGEARYTINGPEYSDTERLYSDNTTEITEPIHKPTWQFPEQGKPFKGIVVEPLSSKQEVLLVALLGNLLTYTDADIKKIFLDIAEEFDIGYGIRGDLVPAGYMRKFTRKGANEH